MKKNLIFLILLNIANVCYSQNNLYQYSLFNVLASGEYDGRQKVRELLLKGSMGLGTFNALNGELILFEGVCYRANAYVKNGSQLEVAPLSDSIPFAVAINFVSDTSFIIKDANKKNIDSIISSFIPSNTIVAIKINALFNTIRYRSVQKQHKPYTALSEAVKSQIFFESQDINGTIIGFYFPGFLKEINVEGFHWHFISSDKTKGGHLIDYAASKLEIEVAYVKNYELKLPENRLLGHKNYEPTQKEIEFIEKGK